MRVLLFTVAWPGERGGVQGVIRRLRDTLEHRGHKVRLAFATSDPHDSRRVKWPFGWKGWWRLLAFRPDVVHVHYASRDADWFLRHRKRFGYRVVITTHGSDVLRPSDADAAGLVQRVRAADAVTAVTPTLVETLAPIREDVRLISNGVDLKFWAKCEPAATTPTLVSVGRLHPVKGFDVLIEAVRQLPGVSVKLIGGGAERDALQVQAQGLDVAFLGEKTPEEIRSTFEKVTAFVLPSRSEGMPLALLEAMAAGLPAVATDVGGVASVLRSGGVLVPAEDADALAAGIRTVLADRDRFAADARRRAADFSSAHTDDAYVELLQNLVSPAVPSGGAERK